MSDPELRAARISKVIDQLPADVRRFFLETFMRPEAERAELIGRLHEQANTPALVELLIDLERDRAIRLELADALKAKRRRR